MLTNTYVKSVYEDFLKKNPNMPEYQQACLEILESLELVVNQDDRIEKNHILERFLEPERFISFRVAWLDDNNQIQVNRGYRVQYNSAIGPYKGGLRFDASVNESIIKFLGLEQSLKNSLTTLPMGGGKGGSDFNPRGKSDNEIMKFCQAFMTELYRHIGPNLDVPAGDLGVGAREVGYMFGQYKRIRNQYEAGVLTGKGISYGGSLARTEATGYGACYFAEEALKVLRNDSLKGKKVIVSGAGNVGTHAVEKLCALGAKVVAMSDISGYIHDENGIDPKIVKELYKTRQLLENYANYKEVEFVKRGTGKSVWNIKCDIAMPCATQNELLIDDAKALVANGVKAVFEVANMPCTLEASHYFIDNGILFGPGKAVNAGGVATSGLEMSQNSQRLSWSFEEVDQKLKGIMEGIFHAIYDTSIRYGIKENDLLTGANIAGFAKICDAMIAQGLY